MEDTIESMISYTQVYDEDLKKRLEDDFSRIKEECYLDHAGATLCSDGQLKNVFTDLQNSLYANPHSIGTASNLTQDIIERTRYLILDHFHTSSEEYTVIFTSGATASLKIVAESFIFNKNENDMSHSGYFLYTQDNHTSVLGMREVVAKRGGKIICLDHSKVFETFNSFMKAENSSSQKSNSLFVYPAQCNFSGLKYPLTWVMDTHNGALSKVINDTPTKWHVLLDAASFVSTNDLDLSKIKPDFVCLSFYKMFGYPTGIGALLVKNSSADVLEKVYYGGGTIDVSLSSEMYHVKRQNLHKRFEDGTAPFLSIVSLSHGLDILSSITMEKISKHVFSLARLLYNYLLVLHHSNGQPVAKLYSDTVYDSRNLQGGIVAFNLMRSNGEYVGYMEVLNMAALFKIHLRTGCFCNPGACQRHLALSNMEVLRNFDSGYVCGGDADLIDGKPTGGVRISFGYMSTIKDVKTLLLMIKKCFVDEPSIIKIPDWWLSHKTTLHKKYSPHIEDRTVMKIDKKQDVRNTTMHFINDTKYFESLNIDASMEKCVLEELYIYPIKSCAAYKVTGSWSLNSKGLQYDREWMIVTSSGTCLTQKQNTNLCLIKPVLLIGKGLMQLTYPGMPILEIPLNDKSKNMEEGTLCQSRICGHKVEGTDCGTDVSEWLSLAIGYPCLKLIKQSDYDNKQKDGNEPKLSFSSQAQYLLINRASVQWLSDKVLDLEVNKETMIQRFRANMIISGCKPFEETNWERIKIKKNNFMISGQCTRCQMICIDQTTGKRTIEPLRTLAKQFHGKMRFGIYLTKQTKEDGVITIGDTIYIS